MRKMRSSGRYVEKKFIERDLDLREESVSQEKLYEDGNQRRAKVPWESHAEWIPPRNRPDPVAIVLASRLSCFVDGPRRRRPIVSSGEGGTVPAHAPFLPKLPVEFLVGEQMSFYSFVCGALLARAHSRVGEPALIAGYCGNSKVLDEALADWAEAYGDQTASDHAALVEAINSGRVKAVSEA
jgi:hypothetical protein